ncbi:MAG: DUF4124 domain-containing protein [Desulfuromonadales bacterium]|nr:MAG: DUF4124 domain-containing protein [Desulfuromonadales bacterium]
MKHLYLITLAFLLLTPAGVRADVYRYVDDDGVECFTDAPRSREAVLVMKERTTSKVAGSKRTVPKHLTATGIGEINVPSASATKQPPEAPGTLPVQGRISSLVGLRHDPLDGTLREHHGIDIAVPEGTPVRPVAPGRIIFAGVRPGYGNMVIVEQGNGTITLYAHNSVNLVSAGDDVAASSTIALSGSTGRSTGPHLHFEAWKDGMNITSSYLPAHAGTTPAHKNLRQTDAISRIVQADGTIYFTNMH